MKRVLLVDDDPDIRDSLTLLLELSYAVTPAEDGAVALELMKAQRFDAVVLDLMMPVLDGTRFLEELHQLGIQVPVILISAHRDLEERHRRLGVFSYLRKPFNIVELEKRLAQALRPGGTGGPLGCGGTGDTALRGSREPDQGTSAGGWPSSTHRLVVSSQAMA
jgi:DNA-binding response OmpR family regulator